MYISQAANFARHGDGQTAVHAADHVPLKHILRGGRASSLSKVNGLVAAICIADEGEAASADARVVHAYDAHAKRGPDQGVCGVALPIIVNQ